MSESHGNAWGLFNGKVPEAVREERPDVSAGRVGPVGREAMLLALGVDAAHYGVIGAQILPSALDDYLCLSVEGLASVARREVVDFGGSFHVVSLCPLNAAHYSISAFQSQGVMERFLKKS